jgi:hypothetical protein
LLDDITQKKLVVVLNDYSAGIDAVFHYKFSGYDKKWIENVQEQTTSMYIAIIQELMLAKTNRYLEIIRNNILEQLKKDLIDEANLIKHKLVLIITDTVRMQKIEREITTCRTILQQEIDSMKDWFVISQLSEWPDYSVDDLFQICTINNQRLFPNYSKIKVDLDIDTDLTFKGYTFRYLYDIINILINNVITHSGFITH